MARRQPGRVEACGRRTLQELSPTRAFRWSSPNRALDQNFPFKKSIFKALSLPSRGEGLACKYLSQLAEPGLALTAASPRRSWPSAPEAPSQRRSGRALGVGPAGSSGSRAGPGGGPALRPHLQDRRLMARPPRGPPSVPQTTAEITPSEVSLDSKQAAFPRGTPYLCLFCLGRKQKAEDKSLGVCLEIVAHHCPLRGTALHCAFQQLPRGGACAGPQLPPSLGKLSQGRWVAHAAECLPRRRRSQRGVHSFAHSFIHSFTHYLLNTYLYQAPGAGHASGHKQAWAKPLREGVSQAKRIAQTSHGGGKCWGRRRRGVTGSGRSGRASPGSRARPPPAQHLPSHSLNFLTSLGSPSSVKSPAWMSTSP